MSSDRPTRTARTSARTAARTASVTLAAVALVAVAGVAAAEPTDATVTAGTLSMSVPRVTDFATVALDGSATTTQAVLEEFRVVDSTGSGAGWKVTAQATRFAEHDGSAFVSGGKQLATGSLRMPAPAVTQVGTSSPSPTVRPGPHTIDAGTAVTIASAAVDQGMGTYDFASVPLTLSLPASTFARTYRSDVVLTVASTP